MQKFLLSLGDKMLKAFFLVLGLCFASPHLTPVSYASGTVLPPPPPPPPPPQECKDANGNKIECPKS